MKMSVGFKPITRQEFESFLDDHTSWSLVDERYEELVYSINLPSERLSVRLFSGIDKHSGKSRRKGSDAIRCVVWDDWNNTPVGGEKRTHRIDTWEKNLLPKIQNLMVNWRDFGTECPRCLEQSESNERHRKNVGLLTKREGKYGEFLSCNTYGDAFECGHTESV